jgi:glycerol-3-phosphate dehydrogenase
MTTPRAVDLLVIGGGINGTGIARDAAGRGLTVLLVEQADLGAATSSASSKLIHGGLRYLEQYEFRLVAEALAEREVLLRCAPHLVRPARFVMPYVPSLRPAWMIRAGLILYDYLARRQTLPGSRAVSMRDPPYSNGLKAGYSRGFAYSDCRVDDSRLVIANARAAADLGAVIMTRTACVGATRLANGWEVMLQPASGRPLSVTAKALANAAGPWADRVAADVLKSPSPLKLKLVQGSHIVVPRLYEGDHAFILQNDDGRVVFAYPYEESYTLIGTTDVEYRGEPGACRATPAEVEYLCRAANRYFARVIAAGDVAWSYCGIRPLVDDGSANPSSVTRDYTLHLDTAVRQAPVLSVFGGKITTYRRLAERALDQLAPWFPAISPRWTAQAVLPGGDTPAGGTENGVDSLGHRYPGLPPALLRALIHRHGSLAHRVLGDAHSVSALGEHFGADLYALEIDYFVQHEWARTAEDILWRRTKTGLHLQPEQIRRVQQHLDRRFPLSPVR